MKHLCAGLIIFALFSLNVNSQNIENYQNRYALEVHPTNARNELSGGAYSAGLQLTLSKYFNEIFSSGIFYYYGPNGPKGDQIEGTYFRVYNEVGISGKYRFHLGPQGKIKNKSQDLVFFATAGISYMFVEYQKSEVREDSGIAFPFYAGFEYYFSKHFCFGVHAMSRLTKYLPSYGLGIQFIIIT